MARELTYTALDTSYQQENLAEASSDLFELLSGKLIELDDQNIDDIDSDVSYNQAA